MSNELILTKDTQLDDAIQLLDRNGNGVLPVVDESNKLLGIITDGDIRKAIINKDLKLENIINRNPTVINKSASTINKIQLLKKIQRRHLPIVDDTGNYIEVFTLDDADFTIRPNWVLIMAGGLGVRLGDLTKDTPKPMLNIAGKPIIERTIENFIHQGFSKFYISVNYKKDVIKNYFKNGAELGVEIKYIEERQKLGTAGALSLLDIKETNPLIVINGDIITSINFNELLDYHCKKNAEATMCVREYTHSIPYGVIDIEDDKMIGMTEKPEIKFNINTGIYILNTNILSKIPKNTRYDMTTLFSMLIENKLKMGIYKLNDYWMDIGYPEDYHNANSHAK
jgi:dTDP-glucose pyrophosphorylase